MARNDMPAPASTICMPVQRSRRWKAASRTQGRPPGRRAGGLRRPPARSARTGV